MSNRDWARIYLENSLYNNDVFSYSFDSFNLPCIVWHNLKLHSNMQNVRELANKYGYHSGISLSFRNKQQCSFFGFASKNDVENNNYLVSHMDELKKFIYYYLSCAHDNKFLLKCYNQKFKIESTKHIMTPFLETVKDGAFMSDLSHQTKRYYFHIGDPTKYFTPREIECLCLAFKNYSAKQIGKCLGISYRVVEEYMYNMRGKVGSMSTKQMCERLSKNELLMSAIEMKSKEYIIL